MGEVAMNIKYMVIIFLSVMPFGAIALKNNQELFLQAVQQQQEKNYGQALHLYEQVNPKGKAVFYNMGLSYYALNKFPQALAYLQKAQLNAGYSDYLLINKQLNTINKQLGKPVIASFWYSSVAAVVSGISLLLLQLLFLMLLYVAWWRFFSEQKKHKQLFFIIIWSLLFVLCSVGLFVKASLQRYTGGVIIEKEVSLRSGPQVDYDSVGTVVTADQVAIIKKADNWYLVKSGSKRGWIPEESFIVVKD